MPVFVFQAPHREKQRINDTGEHDGERKMIEGGKTGNHVIGHFAFFQPGREHGKEDFQVAEHFCRKGTVKGEEDRPGRPEAFDGKEGRYKRSPKGVELDTLSDRRKDVCGNMQG